MSTCPFCSAVMIQVQKATRVGGLYACLNCMNGCLAFRNGHEVECREIENFMDVRLLAPKGTPDGTVLAQVSKALDDLPTLPSVPQRIMRMVYDPMTSVSDIARVVNEDPVLTLKILKLANCAFYGGRQPITSLEVACSRLGIKMIVKVVQAVGSKEVFKTRSKELQGTMRSLWKHSVVTAYCAGEIASLMPILSSDEIFLAGLVHDIGKVVLFNVLNQLYSEGKLWAKPDTDSFEQLVKSYHTLSGLHASQNWELSTELRAATFFHHFPEYTPLEEWKPLVYIVGLANLMATKLGYGGLDKTDEPYETHAAVSFLKLEPCRIQQTQDYIESQVEDLLNAMED